MIHMAHKGTLFSPGTQLCFPQAVVGVHAPKTQAEDKAASGEEAHTVCPKHP